MKSRKTRKKILTALLALAMVFGLACTAFAEDEASTLPEIPSGMQGERPDFSQQNGSRPTPPDGGFRGEDGSRPERPDGEDGSRPELPDGEQPTGEFPGASGEDGSRPELPEGAMPKGAQEMPESSTEPSEETEQAELLTAAEEKGSDTILWVVLGVVALAAVAAVVVWFIMKKGKVA